MSRHARTDHRYDAVVVGDGPSGAVLGAACKAVGLDVVVVGRGAPWTNTYGVWLDDAPDLPRSAFASVSAQVIVGGTELRRLDRPYGIIDNEALRDHLGLGELLVGDEMVGITAAGDHATVELTGGTTLSAHLVIDATGSSGDAARAWQTAYGVVVDETSAADVATTDAVTLMDWSWSTDGPSFVYVVPVGTGWLVEHTVLAASPSIEPSHLRGELVLRLGAAVVEAAEAEGRTETVRIPMGLPVRSGAGPVASFGTAAGMIHPATGYSVGPALRAAPRVAQAIAAGADVHTAIWPRAARRTRALHDVGLEALLQLDAGDTDRFFAAFFGLPVAAWSDYLRIDTPPDDIARVMSRLFRRSPWSVRRRLVAAGPRAVAHRRRRRLPA